MRQPDLGFDQNPHTIAAGRREMKAVAQEGSETSVAAAIAIQIRVGAIDHQVLARIRQSPCTDQEGQDDTEIDGNTWRPSRRRLELAEAILPDGTRKTRSGRQAVVWRVARAGERPGTRRGPGVGTRPSDRAVATGQRQGHGTAGTADLWVMVRDAKPSWMLPKQHRTLLDAAIAAHPDDLAAGLEAALRELRSMGGGR